MFRGCVGERRSRRAWSGRGGVAHSERYADHSRRQETATELPPVSCLPLLAAYCSLLRESEYQPEHEVDGEQLHSLEPVRLALRGDEAGDQHGEEHGPDLVAVED